MSILPKIKSTISSFLLGEEGKISNQSILAIGSFLVGYAATVSSLPQVALGGCGSCACACACACGSCAPTHSSITGIVFDKPSIEVGTHLSHSSA